MVCTFLLPSIFFLPWIFIKNLAKWVLLSPCDKLKHFFLLWACIQTYYRHFTNMHRYFSKFGYIIDTNFQSIWKNILIETFFHSVKFSTICHFMPASSTVDFFSIIGRLLLFRWPLIPEGVLLYYAPQNIDSKWQMKRSEEKQNVFSGPFFETWIVGDWQEVIGNCLQRSLTMLWDVQFFRRQFLIISWQSPTIQLCSELRITLKKTIRKFDSISIYQTENKWIR